MHNKRIIFHLPDYIDFENPTSGSQVRPVKLINAFKKIGYGVDIITGYGNSRQKYINKIKKNIQEGVIYDFVYSESSTTPTLLTEKHHLPSYPLLDFNFLKFCKKNKLKIGLFYRDIYWNFDFFKRDKSLIKNLYLKIFYLYDLYKYNKLVDILFLPSYKMADYIPFNLSTKLEELPPGIEYVNINRIHNIQQNNINYVYVGDIGELYRIDLLIQSINLTDKLYICCRNKDWHKNKDRYEIHLNNNINVCHLSGEKLQNLYKEMDVACLFIEPSLYRSFSMPVKLFEYLSFCLPIISTSGNVVADFIKKHDIGWVINYDRMELENLFFQLRNNPNLIAEKVINIKKILNQNTWEARACFIKEKLIQK